MKNILSLLLLLIITFTSCTKDEAPLVKVESNGKILIKGFAHKSTDKHNLIEVVLNRGNSYSFYKSHIYKIEISCYYCNYSVNGVFFNEPITFYLDSSEFSPLLQ